VDNIEVSIIAVDRNAKIKDGGRDVVQLNLKPETHATITRSGVRIGRRLDVPPGHYQLRVGARDAGSGATGSVLYDLDVPDFSKESLSMSGVLLTSASANVIPSVNPDPEFKAVLPGPPSATREFPRNDSIALFTEVYDNQTRTPHRVAIKASVLADDGTVVYTAGDERSSAELQGQKGGYGYTATIDTKALAPGRYVLRVEAQTLLANGPSVKRELEFRIR
jgi:hypothetical protein